MKKPPVWSDAQLDADIEISRNLFRAERLGESLDVWENVFARHEAKFKRLFDDFGIAEPQTLSADAVITIFREELGDALRYLAAPPISEDDLEVLAQASLNPNSLAADPSQAQRILDTILQVLDPRRFPWVTQERPYTEAEKSAAILASTALLTAQRISTMRRNDGKTAQEQAVQQYLIDQGLVRVANREIVMLTDAPEPGAFCAECMVGSRKADIPVRLFDGRLMAIECKVSNSVLNSIKRVNNDAAVKAEIWRDEIGKTQIIPVAMLSGVFGRANLRKAQDRGLTLFWAHALDELGAFITASRSR